MERWECRELDDVDIAEVRTLMYDTWFSDYFELRDGEDNSKMNCSTTERYKTMTIDGKTGLWVVECSNVKFSHNYKYVFKRPKSKCDGADMTIEEGVINIYIKDDGTHEEGWR